MRTRRLRKYLEDSEQEEEAVVASDDEEEDMEVNSETEEVVEEQIDPYQTWFNRRIFSDEQKVEADRILLAMFSLFTLGIRIR